MSFLPDNFMARQFAAAMHKGQMYGDKEYTVHTSAVAQILIDFGFSGKIVDAGHLHDTIEDTEATRKIIEKVFGKFVGDVVWVCTGTGPNRKTRNATIYAKMSMLLEAAPVKTADRIGNVENCEPGSKHAALYLSERDEFHEHVAQYAPPLMQDRLARAYDRLEGKV